MPGWVQDPETGKLIEREAYYATKWQRATSKVSSLPMPYVRGDLKPYTSPITGQPVEGRAARREELAKYQCREVDPSEYKPVYKNYEFCQKNRLPYMGDAVPPPMTRDEKMQAQARKKAEKAAEKAADAVRAKAAEANIDPGLAKFKRGNAKSAPIFKVKE